MSWKKILNELSFRVSDGVPDLTNEQHLMKLFDVLKEHEWPVEARVELLKNLTEVDIVKKKQKDGSYGGAYTVQKHNPERGQKLITKNASQDQIKQVQKKKKDDGDDDSTQGSEESQVSMSNTIDRGGDSEIKNLALKYGFKEVEGVFKPAPGNAGSLLNEIVSGEVAQMLEENPNLSEEELVGILYKRFGDSELFKSKKKNGNSGSDKPVGGISKNDIPEEHKKEAGLYSKVVLAVRSGKRKHKKATESAKKNGFKNSKIENYYGHSSSFDAMVNDIKDKQVIGPDGTEISQEEAEQLIRSGGGGDNPSDTATLVFDKDSNKVIMLFHSDKDSTEALIAQSSIKAEAEANEENIDKMVEGGSLTKEQGEKVKKDQQEMVRKNEEIESKLKKVVVKPGKFFQKNVEPKVAINSIKNDENLDGSTDKNSTKSKWPSVVNNGKINTLLKKYLPEGVDPNNVSDEQAYDAFLKFMSDEDKGVHTTGKRAGEPIEPTANMVTLMERLNSRFIEQGAPDIFSELEDIRNESLQLQRDFITEQDKIKVKIDGKEVGMGTLLEANTVWKQFHLEASNPNSDQGVHKYPGMLETNHGGLSVDGEVLRKCMGGDVENKNDFIVRFEVGPLEEQKGVSGTQKGKTTGGKRIVYAITSGGEKIEVGQKVMRTKTGKTGKLQTVYNWSKDMKDCFEKEGKR